MKIWTGTATKASDSCKSQYIVKLWYFLYLEIRSYRWRRRRHVIEYFWILTPSCKYFTDLKECSSCTAVQNIIIVADVTELHFFWPKFQVISISLIRDNSQTDLNIFTKDFSPPVLRRLYCKENRLIDGVNNA
jgi:hypothetical protein